ncbi:MAG: hypothetical protein ACSNEK_03375 [Parachlamydiaceae bacterium]
MRNFFCCLLFAVFTQLPLFSTIEAPSTHEQQRQYPVLTPEEEDRFLKLMQQAIDKAEQTLKAAQHQATRHDVMPTWESKVEFQHAITMYEVKKTLMNNFKGTESLRSPAVRAKLLQVLNSADISTADLADLQSLVLNEKEHIHDEDQTINQRTLQREQVEQQLLQQRHGQSTRP